MSRVRSKGNKSTELKLIKLFKENHIIGWRRNYKIYGNPDFVFFKYKIAVFVDGCFWHGHDCRNTKPKDNADYWKNKIEKNKNRDLIVNNYLRKKCWTVYRIWECEIKNKKLPDKLKKMIENNEEST